MSPDIRPAATGDEALLAGLNAFVQELHVGRRPDHFKPTQSADLATSYRALLETATSRIWIAEENGVPVGYLLAIVHEASENPFARARRWCEIDQVAVDPSRRRRRIARALILNAVSWAKTEGVSHIEAASWSFNDGAHELFGGLALSQRRHASNCSCRTRDERQMRH